MVERQRIDEALEDVRPLVQADGADLAIEAVDEAAGAVTVRLLLDGVSCLDCVLPTDLLETMISDAMTRRVPGLAAVRLDDPRQTA